METITIQFDDSTKTPLIIKHLNKLDVVMKVDVDKSQKKNTHAGHPIQWASGSPSISDFAGFWKDTNITLDELRKKAWKRN